MTPDGYRRVGYVLKPHGVDGSFVLYCETDLLDWLLRQPVVFAQVDGEMRPWNLEKKRRFRETAIFRAAEVQNRDQVTRLRGTPLFVHDSDALAASDDEFIYNSELVGMALVDDQMGEVGQVGSVLDLPGQTLLQVNRGTATYMVPFVHAIVYQIDRDQQKLRVRLPEGLMDVDG
ncbi:MAG: 16S rRNA processing protein RimM [Acidobacteria bacterium]|nr:16S rRNA processing protein RimM [Acidobacteriota bacterium]